MKKILFTGARSGIAHATIKKLLDKDYLIYLTVHTEKQLELVNETYKEYNNVICMKLDVTDEKDIKQLDNLNIDILVSNAAIGEGGSIAEIPMDKVRYNFEVNVFSSFTVIQLVLKQMMKKEEGKIIIMSSLAGTIPLSFLGVYSATKASISTLTTTLYKELKLINKNIKIVLIEPGMYHTGFNQVMLDNKYEWMHIDSYFKAIIEEIRKKENMMFDLLEKYNLDSITKKIEKAIIDPNPRFAYRAPLSQAISARIYSFFKK